MKHCPKRLAAVALTTLLVAGCATDPLREGVIGPDAVVASPSAYQGQPQEWAGVIERIENLEDETVLEVRSYPITRTGRPGLSVPSNGRFIAVHDGYLEPIDFAPGRRVTVRGILSEVRAARPGDRDRLPVLEMTGVTLWTPPAPEDEPRVRFGIGLGVGVGF